MVKFDEFTNKYFKIFMNKREKMNFILLNDLSKKIKQNIKTVSFKVEDYEIPKNKINKLVNTKWVYTEGVLNNLTPLECNKKIIWNYDNIEHFICIKSTYDKFNSFVKRVGTFISILNYMYDIRTVKEKRPIKIYLILTLLKKELDDNIVGPKNVNSGYTDFITKEIFLWREEEFEKITFHEMAHWMELDANDMSFDDKDLPHKIEGPKSYFEMYTEMWGVMYHTIYLSIILNKSAQSLFEIEYQFMKNQANLFNKYFGLGNWDKKKTIKQKSPSFTYFILKFMLIDYIIKNNIINPIENARDILKNLLKQKFIESDFIDCKSARMTLIQLY
jgi:hypothetical protein